MTNEQKRELLALAAKAAGLSVKLWEGFSGTMCAIDDVRHGRMWMPLDDDGDCARLAASVEIDTHFRVVGSLRVEALPPGGPLVVQTYASADERMLAWRLAVVRAAAEYYARMNRGGRV